MIWKIKPPLEKLNERSEGTAVSHMGILITEIGDDFLKGKIEVNEKTIQPYKIP